MLSKTAFRTGDRVRLIRGKDAGMEGTVRRTNVTTCARIKVAIGVAWDIPPGHYDPGYECINYRSVASVEHVAPVYDCDTCHGTGIEPLWPGQDDGDSRECPVCDGTGRSDEPWTHAPEPTPQGGLPMLSKTAQLAADRAVRSIVTRWNHAPARMAGATLANEAAVSEANDRGYRYNVAWIDTVYQSARSAIENRIQAGAPNAANAAPLMPICDACHGTGKNASYQPIYGPKHENCPTCDGTGRLRATREGFPAIIRPGHLGADESLPAYAWPGGYPLVYLPCDEHGDTSACVLLCADCATHDLHLPDATDDDTRMTSVVEDGDLEQDTVCDGCNAVIAHQNYCHDCRECVDTEDAPHLCPATEPYTVRYLGYVPGNQWVTVADPAYGPDEARRLVGRVRAEHNPAFIHYQPARLDFPPVISEEEE